MPLPDEIMVGFLYYMVTEVKYHPSDIPRRLSLTQSVGQANKSTQTKNRQTKNRIDTMRNQSQNSTAHTQKFVTQNTKRILIVEQSESVSIVYKSILLQQGYTILTAMCGEEALALLDSFRPNLIISADELSDMNSDQLRRRVTVQSREAYIPFLVLSAQKTAQFYATSSSTKLNETLFLPFRMKDLRSSVQRLLGVDQLDDRAFYYPSNPGPSYRSQSVRVESNLHAYA